MSVIAVEGVVENGLIRLTSEAVMPEGARVYVIVPDAVPARAAQGRSVEPSRREDVADFEMTMIE